MMKILARRLAPFAAIVEQLSSIVHRSHEIASSNHWEASGEREKRPLRFRLFGSIHRAPLSLSTVCYLLQLAGLAEDGQVFGTQGSSTTEKELAADARRTRLA
jgi:hypothetical protein